MRHFLKRKTACGGGQLIIGTAARAVACASLKRYQYASGNVQNTIIDVYSGPASSWHVRAAWCAVNYRYGRASGGRWAWPPGCVNYQQHAPDGGRHFPPSVPDIYPLIVGICPLDKFLTFLDEKTFDKHFLKRKNVYYYFSL